MQTDIIIFFIKLFVMNIYAYYSYNKICNIKDHTLKRMGIILVGNFLLCLVCTYIEFFINSFLAIIIICFLYGSLLGAVAKNKIGYSLMITLISYAICTVCQVISVIIEYLPYFIFKIYNKYVNLLLILLIQFVLIYRFFKIKRFDKGFKYLHNKLNNDYIDSIIINISTVIILVYCVQGTIYDDITKNLLFTFLILGFLMFATIQKTFIMNYKQKLLEDTLKDYEREIAEKDLELEELKSEKFNISKITHEFYNRQKSLQLLVKEKLENETLSEEEKEYLLTRVENITNEYSKEIEKAKTTLMKLEETGIPEIDEMFKYMQTECATNKIEFKLKIVGNIYPLVNNIIPKNKLETMIGDHLRDAINAIKSSENNTREIFTILGIKDNKYELCIYDTGIEFQADTLMKLGLEAVTTHKETGGSGIGFLTTFETMKETKASLIIKEFPPKKDTHYTKAVIIRFDGNNDYRICTYRSSELKKKNKDKRIIIEKI